MSKPRSKIPLWKRWLSYLYDVQIDYVYSDINDDLYVQLSKGKLQLCTSGAIYSYEDKYDNFRLLFDQLDWNQLRLDQVLCLGLGLGSVPMLLNKHAERISQMVVVEIDEYVIYLAERYGMQNLDYPYHVVQADAQVYVDTTSETFDMLLSDIFLDDQIPKPFRKVEYLMTLKQLCTKEGLVIVNTMASTDEDKAISQQYFDEVFTKVYPHGQLVHCWENYMLLSRNDVKP